MDVWRHLGPPVAALVMLMVIASAIEGIGIILMLPLLGNIGVARSVPGGRVDELLQQGLAVLGIQPGLLATMALVLSVFFVQNVIFLGQSFLSARLQNRYLASWRKQLFAAYMGAAWPFFVSSKSGTLINILIGETNRLGGAFFLLVQIASAMILTAIYVALALTVSPTVTACLLGVSLVVMMLARGVTSRGYFVGQAIGDRGSELQTAASELIGGAKLVKATSTEQAATTAFGRIVDALESLLFWSSLQPNLLRSIFEFTAICGLCGVLVFGVTYFTIGPAEILVVLALFMRLYPRLSSVQQNIQTLNVYAPAIVAAERIMSEALAAQEELDEAALPSPIGKGPCSIQVLGLSLRYGEVDVLTGVDLELPAGVMAGLVGPSGAGKSTLVDCLLRLAEPQSGSITIDGVPVAELPLRAWRRIVGYVGQDTFLFHASIRDNILWGAGQQADADVIVAAKMAHADEFIAALPAGYDTIVGDRGARLSGGQKQRIGLARALIRRPSLLILDEATSALDSDSERIVLSALEGLRGKITIISIAHRLSTVRSADRIHLLDCGRIIEAGGFDELLALDRQFARLWNRQNELPGVTAQRVAAGALQQKTW